MTQHRLFRFAMIAVLAVALFLLYALHPVAGWVTLIAVGIFAVGWKKRARTAADTGA